MFATLEGSSVLWCLLDDEEGKSGLGKPLRPVASPGPSPPFPRLSTSPAIPGIGAMSDWPTPQVFPDGADGDGLSPVAGRLGEKASPKKNWLLKKTHHLNHRLSFPLPSGLSSVLFQPASWLFSYPSFLL